MVFRAHGVLAVVSVYRCLPCAGNLLFYTGMSGDTVAMSVASSSPSPTGGLFGTQAYSAGVNDGSAGRM